MTTRGKTDLSHYSETFKIRSYQVDFMNQLTPRALMSYMQEVATLHGEQLGFGYEKSISEGYYWVLARVKYDMFDLPSEGQMLDVETWLVGTEGLCVLRRYTFKVAGQVVGQAFSYWLTLSIDRGRPIRPPSFIERTQHLQFLESDLFHLSKTVLPKEMKDGYHRKIHLSDLDKNNHVNNTRYGMFVKDAFSHDQLSKESITSMQINFLKEVTYGDVLEVAMVEVQGLWVLCGKVEGKIVFTSQVVKAAIK